MIPTLKQTSRLPTRAQIDAVEHWVVVLRDSRTGLHWAKFPYAEVLEAPLARVRKDAPDAILTTDLANAKAGHVTLTALKSDIVAFDLLSRAGKLLAPHSGHKPAELGIAVLGFSPRQAERIAEAIISAALAAAADMPDYRSRAKERAPLEQLYLYGAAPRHRFARSIAESEGNALARELTALPPNELTPTIYRKRIMTLARESGWQAEFIGINQLQKKEAGAFLAVCQASPERDAGIMHLRYRPAAKSTDAGLALVGKGICYDTGGVNVKPARYMLGMHEDMEGSAVALGILLTLTRLKVRLPVDCWLAIATNHIGPGSYKPNDVVKAANGTSIEVIHSDAEGRMVLADTLVLASRAKPRLVIDFATLTGSCVQALGKAYSGVFTNQPGWWKRLIQAGIDSGERVWPFPLDEDYDQALESKIADVKQCSEAGEADHILGARFLGRFVEQGVPWIHVDLSSGNRKGGLAHIPTDTTGFGVRYTLNLLLDQKLL